MRATLIVVMLASLGAGDVLAQANLAQATSGFLYFNRPGASIADHDSELKNCADVASNNYIASALASDRPMSFSLGQGPVADAIGHTVLRSSLSRYQRAHWNIVLEHCMVARGWRLMRLDAATGSRLEETGRGALSVELAPMVGAEHPPGELARAWANEGAAAGTIFAISPRDARRVMLSTFAVSIDARAPALPVAIDSGRTSSDTQIQAVDLSSSPTIGEGQALLVAGLTGPRANSRHYIIELRRQNGNRVETLHINYADAQRVAEDRLQNTQGFIVSAGEWAVSGYPTLMNYCLGAPSFTVGSGEVVFIGQFDHSVQLRPDLSEAAMQLHVPASILGNARIAEWENGATWACPGTNLYALEFDGFPFRSGYHWGSRASQTSGAPP